jgi:hypothetical protein
MIKIFLVNSKVGAKSAVQTGLAKLKAEKLKLVFFNFWLGFTHSKSDIKVEFLMWIADSSVAQIRHISPCKSPPETVLPVSTYSIIVS